MPPHKIGTEAQIVQFTNCRILRGHELIWEDLWIREGRILDPEKLFFEEKKSADVKKDCEGHILAPGFIDVQINGGFGVDFSLTHEDISAGVALVAKNLLAYGVTSFCPTLVTSPPDVYHKVLPQITVRNGSSKGAGVLGAHVEGPFISHEKRGAHPDSHLRTFEGDAFQELLKTYGSLDNIAIITLAPELKRSHEVIKELTSRGVCVSVGHSVSHLKEAEEAVRNGARFITHLFNAMLPFHHRDPGIVGLLTSDQIAPEQQVFFGMIADGIHTHPAALRIAHRAHPKGTNTLCGSVASLDTCVRHFLQATGCSVETALEAATLHPAQLLGIEKQKGTLDFGSDADFVVLDDSLNVKATYIAGDLVWKDKTFSH
ncbi:N-acetylglucosamine-6-phosphate deacetylase isoform X2 [Vombatus ursinus]|uniref:N-acetylglucosamine-6-phosphate deacetylase n=1 Tax=Vombatus ursinus TaxID=29139 RepID=A0A4X2KIL6_VOMUR|nr:N-acetylglucosamine-6-phosphate deacetylase isoform X2 [Vombatus ursinus]